MAIKMATLGFTSAAVLTVQKKYDVMPCVDEASVVVSVQTSAVSPGLVSCIITVTSALMRTHPFQYYNGLLDRSFLLPPRSLCFHSVSLFV